MLIINYDEVDALGKKTYRSFGNIFILNDQFRSTVTPLRIFSYSIANQETLREAARTQKDW